MFGLMDRIPLGVDPMLSDLENYITQNGIDDMKACAEIITTVSPTPSFSLSLSLFPTPLSPCLSLSLPTPLSPCLSLSLPTPLSPCLSLSLPTPLSPCLSLALSLSSLPHSPLSLLIFIRHICFYRIQRSTLKSFCRCLIDLASLWRRLFTTILDFSLLEIR